MCATLPTTLMKFVQGLWLQLGVALQVLPRAVPAHQGNVLNLKPILKQSADALMPEVVEVKVRDAKSIASLLEVFGQRLRVDGKDALIILRLTHDEVV